jgi:hypothetical protein
VPHRLGHRFGALLLAVEGHLCRPPERDGAIVAGAPVQVLEHEAGRADPRGADRELGDLGELRREDVPAADVQDDERQPFGERSGLADEGAEGSATSHLEGGHEDGVGDVAHAVEVTKPYLDRAVDLEGVDVRGRVDEHGESVVSGPIDANGQRIGAMAPSIGAATPSRVGSVR